MKFSTAIVFSALAASVLALPVADKQDLISRESSVLDTREFNTDSIKFARDWDDLGIMDREISDVKVKARDIEVDFVERDIEPLEPRFIGKLLGRIMRATFKKFTG